MMNFRVIKNAIVQTLENNKGSDFRVVGYRKQTRSAQEVTNDNKIVKVYYTEGQLPARGNSNQYGAKHQCTFNVEFTVSAAATGDLDTATDSNATAAERAAAIAGIQEAADKVSDDLDIFIERVYQIIMNAANRDFGLPVGIISGRTIERIQKNDPIDNGALIVQTGIMDLTCNTFESIQGYTDPSPGSAKTIDTEIKNQDDEVSKTGVVINTP